VTERVTLEDTDHIVEQLPPQDQLKLVARIGERLSALVLRDTDDDHRRKEYTLRMETFLKLSKEEAAEAIGLVDSAEDIRQIREERTSRL
jgi:hypothetical protein